MFQIASEKKWHQISQDSIRDQEVRIKAELDLKYKNHTELLQSKLQSLSLLVEAFKEVPKVLSEIRRNKMEINSKLRTFNGNVAASMDRVKNEVCS